MIRQKTLLIPLLLSIILGYGAFRFHAISGLSDQTIRADGTGYYSFLPAIFIYQDLSFSFLDNKELVNDDGAARVTLNNGKIVNKYSCGIAILQLPFFLLAYFLSFFNGNEITGYGPLFQQTFLIGTIFYFFLGLIYLNKILQHFKINLWITSLTLVLFGFGNTIFHYIVYDAYMSHSFSLSLMIILVYQVIRFKEKGTIKQALGMGITFGLLALVRPFNLIAVLCLPILFSNFATFWNFIKKLLSRISWVTLSFLLVISIQFILWKLQTDSFLVYSYGGEKFVWGTHDFSFALIEFRRGFFIYNPIWIAACIFYIYHFKKIPFSFINLLIAFSIIAFLLSSWHAKLYGMSLGYRPLLEYQIFLFFPFLHIYKNLKSVKWLNIVTPIILSTVIWYSITLTIQYQKTIIPWEGPNWTQYKELFGQTDDRYKYHFFYPPKLSEKNWDTVQIPHYTSQIFSDQGYTINPKEWTKDSLLGIGYYCQIITMDPKFASGIMHFYHGKEIPHRIGKLISKDIKEENKILPFYIEESWKNQNFDSVVVKFHNIREAKLLIPSKGKLILYTKPFKKD